MTRTSIERLADCAPVASAESWIARKIPGISPSFVEIRHPYLDEVPVMAVAHAAIEEEARATARAAIKMRARAYALRPRDLDAIAEGLVGLSPRNLVIGLSLFTAIKGGKVEGVRWYGFGGEVPAINLKGAVLYARYSRAKAHQIAGREA